MPVIEAMACGCPVITTAHGALAEAAGGAAHVISGISVDEMCSALDQLQVAEYRQALSAKGLAHASRFRWNEMARVFTDAVESLARPPTEEYLRFAHEWRRLREIQASVDSEY
jgi:glycosyltransferase involved in cell wall biosynthesis